MECRSRLSDGGHSGTILLRLNRRLSRSGVRHALVALTLARLPGFADSGGSSIECRGGTGAGALRARRGYLGGHVCRFPPHLSDLGRATRRHQPHRIGYLIRKDDREPGSDEYFPQCAPSAAPSSAPSKGLVPTALSRVSAARPADARMTDELVISLLADHVVTRNQPPMLPRDASLAAVWFPAS